MTILGRIRRGILSRLRRQGLKFASGNPKLAALYFATLDFGLSRENAAVAAGRLRYARDTSGEGPSFYLLRRNIHRLEKGLIMRPRRPKFALDYISETLNVYERALRSDGGTIEEHRWAQDVLRAYFDAIDVNDAEVAPHHRRFVEIEGYATVPDGDGPARIPYARALSEPPPVDFDAMHALSIRRRSVRWYDQRPVPRDLVDQAIAVAAQAPSACNRQPFVYRIFDEPERARKLAAIPLGTKGFSDQLTGVVVMVGRLRAYPETRDRHAIYVDGGLSAMAFMYALETLGIASCPINWPDIEPQESIMTAELGLEPDERVIMLIAYGWPDPAGMVPYSAKREHTQLRSYG